MSLERLLDLARTLGTLGLFTTPEVGPDAVARALLERGLHGFTAHVCENLGTPRERITQGSLAEIASLKFDPLNILILLRDPGSPPRLRPTGAVHGLAIPTRNTRRTHRPAGR